MEKGRGEVEMYILYVRMMLVYSDAKNPTDKMDYQISFGIKTPLNA